PVDQLDRRVRAELDPVSHGAPEARRRHPGAAPRTARCWTRCAPPSARPPSCGSRAVEADGPCSAPCPDCRCRSRTPAGSAARRSHAPGRSAEARSSARQRAPHRTEPSLRLHLLYVDPQDVTLTILVMCHPDPLVVETVIRVVADRDRPVGGEAHLHATPHPLQPGPTTGPFTHNFFFLRSMPVPGGAFRFRFASSAALTDGGIDGGTDAEGDGFGVGGGGVLRLSCDIAAAAC